ncbi:MAG: efflux RND transporter periplasmic adaptor subunit [Pseudomonadota bacterium]
MTPQSPLRTAGQADAGASSAHILAMPTDLESRPSRWRFLASARRWWWLVLALVVLALAGAWALSRGDGKPAAPAASAPQSSAAPRVTVMTPGRPALAAVVEITGTLTARHELPVDVEGEGGRVVAVLAEAGDRVAAGQVLARLNRDIVAQQVAQLAATLEEAEANARLAAAENERALSLRGKGTLSEAEIDRRAAQAVTSAARVKIIAAQLREAQLRLARTEVRAPAAGIILARAVERGQTVLANGQPLFRIAEDGAVELRGEVAEQDLPKLALGQAATVTISGAARQFTGRVRLLGPTIDPQTRLGTVHVALDPHPLLRPGAFAQARINVGQTHVPVVPYSAVQTDAEGAFVLVVGADNKVARRAVRVTGAVGDGAIIGEGLEGNEEIVAAAAAFLHPGEEIEPVRAAPTAEAR